MPGDAEKTLFDCDIYGSAEAGNALKRMLAMGRSKPWPDAMETLTGQRKMDAGPLLEYFQPLHDWLIKTNKANGAHVGWEKSDSKGRGKEEGQNILLNLICFFTPFRM